MIGHGRPASLSLALARAALILCACLGSRAVAENPPSPEPVRLRITWGGGEASQWRGRIAVDDGNFSNLKLLEPESDAAASIWLESGQLQVAALSPHKLDRIECDVQSSSKAKLLIDLAAAGRAAPPRLEIPLADLPRHPYQVRLDDRGNTLEIRIVPPPSLRISANHNPLIYAPGEQCTFDLSATIPNLTPGTEINIQTTLSAGRSKEPIWKGDSQRLAVPVDGHPKASLAVPLPKTEGVYTVHVAATRPSGFERFWSSTTRLAQRSFQIVVLDTHPPEPAPGAHWESVLEIDPTNPRWFDRFPGWTQIQHIPGLNHSTLGSGRTVTVDLPLGRFVELPPAPPTGGPHWEAYSLPLKDTGVPHMLEIDYPADSEQHFGISIVEPNAYGVVSGVNRDSDVYVEGLGRNEAKQTQTQRLVFWPRTQAPLLVITNLHPTAAAHFGQIRVFKRSTNRLTTDQPANGSPRNRLIAAYLARPTAPETFGATQAIDPISAANGVETNCVDDSETAYETASRMADYLRYCGYNSAVVNVPLADQVDSSAGPNALEVDPLELMLRVFDREGISLLPAIDFTAPLPKLEAMRRQSDPQTSGLEWVGADGRSWLDANGTRDGRAPYYNLLDPRVQQAMLEHVRSLIDRYGRHPSFAGLSVQLSSHGYAQLPPLDWGLDDATFARFAHDKGITPTGTGPDRFAARHALVTGQAADAWRTWRAAQVSAFYARLASLVRGNSDRRLLLTTENMFADPQLAMRLRPSLIAEHIENRVASTMLDVGIDRQSLERAPGIVLCPARYVESMTSLPDRAVDLELNEAFALWRQRTSPAQSRAAVLFHRPVRQRLASFEAARTPWRVLGQMQLVCQPMPLGPNVRQPYLEALNEMDPSVLLDGGDLLPLGQEKVLREVRSVVAQLPTGAEVTQVAKQPVIIRTYAEANRVTFVAMNMSPWHCNAQVTLDVPQATTLEPLLPSTTDEPAAGKSLALSAGQQSWPISLAPYELRAVRIPLHDAKAVGVQADISDAANTELTAKLADLTNRDLTAPPVYQALANPSFEPMARAGRLPHWRLSDSIGTATAELDATHPQDGKTCLYFRRDVPPLSTPGNAAKNNDGRSPVVESDEFPIPPTGQLAMTVFARGHNLAPATELRLIFETDCNGQTYRRAASVSAAKLQHADGQWGFFAILVNDLPLDSHGQMRIAFELTGPGEVWLDNVKLYDLLFPLTFYTDAQAEILQLSKQIHAAKSAFDARQISDCLQILDGYWPRFIQTYRPPVQPQVAVRGTPTNEAASPPKSNEGQEPAPGIGDRIKRFVPILR